MPSAKLPFICDEFDPFHPEDNVCIRVSLTRGQSIGLSLTAEAGFISLISVLILFVLIFVSGGWNEVTVLFTDMTSAQYPVVQAPPPTATRSLIQEPVDVYMLSLFISDLIQAIGTVMDVKWVHHGVVEANGYCTAQGVVQQLGETAVALATLVITIHTFVTVWMRRGTHSRLVAICIVALLWTFVIIFVAVGASTQKSYITPTPYWCWISGHYPNERIGGEYLWLWVTLFSSILLYVPLFFWVRGNLVVDSKHWWKVTAHWNARSIQADNAPGVRARPAASAVAILAYPVIYVVIVLPLSIVRWIGFHQERHGGTNTIPSVATFIVIFVYGLSGALNVLLLLFTRQNLLLFGRPDAERHCTDCGVRTDRDGYPLRAVNGAGNAAPRPPSPGRPAQNGMTNAVLREGRLWNDSAESGWDFPAQA